MCYNSVEAPLEPTSPSKWQQAVNQILEKADDMMDELSRISYNLDYLGASSHDIPAVIQENKRKISAGLLWQTADQVEQYGYEEEAEAVREIADYIERKSFL